MLEKVEAPFPKHAPRFVTVTMGIAIALLNSKFICSSVLKLLKTDVFYLTITVKNVFHCKLAQWKKVIRNFNSFCARGVEQKARRFCVRSKIKLN